MLKFVGSMPKFRKCKSWMSKRSRAWQNVEIHSEKLLDALQAEKFEERRHEIFRFAKEFRKFRLSPTTQRSRRLQQATAILDHVSSFVMRPSGKLYVLQTTRALQLRPSSLPLHVTAVSMTRGSRNRISAGIGDPAGCQPRAQEADHFCPTIVFTRFSTHKKVNN